MEIILWLLAGHFIGDFAFQSQWMAENKGKSWEINAYHALVCTFAIFVVADIGGFALPVWALSLILVSHFLIDPLSARWGIIKHIWLDQILHLAVLAIVVVLLV